MIKILFNLIKQKMKGSYKVKIVSLIISAIFIGCNVFYAQQNKSNINKNVNKNCSSPLIDQTRSDKVKLINFKSNNYEYKKINIRRKSKDCSGSRTNWLYSIINNLQKPKK